MSCLVFVMTGSVYVPGRQFEQLLAGSSLTDVHSQDIHTITLSFGSQFVHRDTPCALQETLNPLTVVK
jgi:hypothetical protein